MIALAQTSQQTERSASSSGASPILDSGLISYSPFETGAVTLLFFRASAAEVYEMRDFLE